MAVDSPSSSGFRSCAVLLVRFLVGALFVWCALLLIPWEPWLFELPRHFRMGYVVMGAVLLVFMLLLRQWRWVPVALLTVAWQGYPWYVWQQPDGPVARSGAPRFTILTCNLLWEAGSKAGGTIDSLRAAEADVIVFQEFTPAWQRRLKKDLWDLYPHRVERPMEGAFGICLASRLPFGQSWSATDDGGSPVAAGVILLEGRSIGILGVHPLPPMSPAMGRKWRASLASWPTLLRRLQCDHQVLAGDFNSTPFSMGFQGLCEAAGLRDGARGFGLVNTWIPVPSMPAGLPLDHILISGALQLTDYRIGPPLESDHRWVRAVIAPVDRMPP